MFTIQRIGVYSTGRLMACVYAFIGLIAGAIFSLLSMVSPAMHGPNGAPQVPPFMGVFAIIALPILYALMGFIGGIIGAALYNLCASFVGGVEIELRQEPITRIE